MRVLLTCPHKSRGTHRQTDRQPPDGHHRVTHQDGRSVSPTPTCRPQKPADFLPARSAAKGPLLFLAISSVDETRTSPGPANKMQSASRRTSGLPSHSLLVSCSPCFRRLAGAEIASARTSPPRKRMRRSIWMDTCGVAGSAGRRSKWALTWMQ
jgi:hypothetical protein